MTTATIREQEGPQLAADSGVHKDYSRFYLLDAGFLTSRLGALHVLQYTTSLLRIKSYMYSRLAR